VVTGTVQPAQGYQRGHSHRIVIGIYFVRFAKSGERQADGATVALAISANALSSFGAHRHESKKKTRCYRERNPAKRADFVAQISNSFTIAPEYMWMNPWMSVTTMAMDGVSGVSGLRRKESGRRTGRINVIAAYREQQLMAPFTVEGACNRAVVFETWLESHVLVPTPDSCGRCTLDNAEFHGGSRLYPN